MVLRAGMNRRWCRRPLGRSERSWQVSSATRWHVAPSAARCRWGGRRLGRSLRARRRRCLRWRWRRAHGSAGPPSGAATGESSVGAEGLRPGKGDTRSDRRPGGGGRYVAFPTNAAPWTELCAGSRPAQSSSAPAVRTRRIARQGLVEPLHVDADRPARRH